VERDYAAIIAAMREKAKRTEFPEEREALEAKAKELEEKYDVRKPAPEYVTDPRDWVRDNYNTTFEEFVQDLYRQESGRRNAQQYIVFVKAPGEDPKWRRSYLWPSDGSPMMNVYHPWDDTEE
jgi:hypothetical protein